MSYDPTSKYMYMVLMLELEVRIIFENCYLMNFSLIWIQCQFK